MPEGESVGFRWHVVSPGSLGSPTPSKEAEHSLVWLLQLVLWFSGCLGTGQAEDNSSSSSSPGTYTQDARSLGLWRSEEAGAG